MDNFEPMYCCLLLQIYPQRLMTAFVLQGHIVRAILGGMSLPCICCMSSAPCSMGLGAMMVCAAERRLTMRADGGAGAAMDLKTQTQR